MHILRIFLGIAILVAMLHFAACVSYENDLGAENCVGNCTWLYGYLTTGDGTEPLKNVPVVVTWNKVSAELGGGIVRTKAHAMTNSAGFYLIKFALRDDESNQGYYEVQIHANDDHIVCGTDGYSSFDVGNLTPDSVTVTNFYLPYRAGIRVSSEGVATMKKNDLLSLTLRYSMGVDGKQGCGDVLTWGSGDDGKVATTVVASDEPVILETSITRDGLNSFSYDTLQLARGEVTDFTAVFK